MSDYIIKTVLRIPSEQYRKAYKTTDDQEQFCFKSKCGNLCGPDPENTRCISCLFNSEDEKIQKLFKKWKKEQFKGVR